MKIRSMRLFIIVLLSTIFIFSMQYGLSAVMMKLFDTTKGFPKGTIVGAVDIGGKVKEQAEADLGKKTEAWASESRIQLVYQDVVIAIPASMFIFDVVDSIQHVQNGKHTPLAVSINKEELQTLLLDKLNGEIAAKLDMKKLEGELLKAAASFTPKMNIPVISLLDQAGSKKTVAQGTVLGAAKYTGLQQWAEQYATLTVPPKSEVSLAKLVQEKKVQADNETLSVLATLMYKTILPTNFQVRQRSISLDLPPYAELGEEARFEKNRADFVFYNPNETPYILKFELTDNTARLFVEGLPFVHVYAVNRQEISSIPKQTVVEAVMANGAKHDAVVPQSSGEDGYVVKVYRELYRSNGSFVKREKMAEDYYLPTNQVKWSLVQPRTQPITPSTAAPQTGSN